jgi:NAD+ kinase
MKHTKRTTLQLKLRGQAPKALRWKRLKQRFNAHRQCVTDLIDFLQYHDVNFSCVNRVELDRQHLSNVDLMVAVGGDGTLLSSAHFLDHGTIPLLGINSDPNVRQEDRVVKKKVSDERRSHGALCMCTALDMKSALKQVLYGAGHLQTRTRIQCTVKSTFSETRLVPALNDLLFANPSPAAVSRFRLGWLRCSPDTPQPTDTPHSMSLQYGTISRFGGKQYDVVDSINVWSSGMWTCTGTGSTAAMAAAGGKPMQVTSDDLQYLIREHMLEQDVAVTDQHESSGHDINNGLVHPGEKMHLRWNSQRGRIFIDGSHLTHDLELGDEIMIDNQAPPLKLYSSSPSLSSEKSGIVVQE